MLAVPSPARFETTTRREQPYHEKLEHVTDIQAPAATVWQVLTATEQYDQWNPFMPCLAGALRVGERLTVTIRTGGRTMRFRPIVETL